MLGAVIWLSYIVIMWKKYGGVKSSVSALFNYLKGSYTKRRLVIAVIYVAAAFFLARAIWLLDVSFISNIFGIVGTAGLAGAGIIPDSRNKAGSYSKLKDKAHIISTLIAIVCSMIYIVMSSIILQRYWFLLIPAVTIAATVYMLREKVKNHTTWIELAMFFAVLMFINLI